MKQIPLTQGKFALVDDEDYEFFMQWKWFADKRKRKNFPDDYRAARKENRKTILMHRELVLAVKTDKIDHWDHNSLNNQKLNLRKCSQHNNCCNKRVVTRDLPRGVWFDKKLNKYLAQIMVKRKNIYLGYHDTPILAAEAYNEASIKYHGEFSILNAA